MQSSTRPDISFVPLENLAFDSRKKRYKVSRSAVILSVMFFIMLILLAIFIALFTSFVQAQQSAATATASASETPS